MPDKHGHAAERAATENVGSVAPSRHDKCMRGQEPVVREDGSIEIPLTQGQVSVVDPESYRLVLNQLWFAQWDPQTVSFYAHGMTPMLHGKRRLLQMHREVTRAESEQHVDHEDHDTLNNRRNNLRIATQNDNMHNRRPKRNRSSRFKGITRRPHGWEAAIRCDGRQLYLGTFPNEEDAARAYDVAAREHFGEFALTNDALGLLRTSDDPV